MINNIINIVKQFNYYFNTIKTNLIKKMWLIMWDKNGNLFKIK